jgi:mannose-6-phosphate isomerase-like protein (cupin superfamily)
MVRVCRVDSVPTETIDGTQRADLVSGEIGAERFGMLLITVRPGSPPHVKYHFHKKKETAFFILKGKARIVVENKEYVVGPNDIIFVPPGEKHQLVNVGNTELKIIEVYSPLPFEGDFFLVDEGEYCASLLQRRRSIKKAVP